jgi:hypothetical protein
LTYILAAVCDRIYRLDDDSIVLSGIDGLSSNLLSYAIRGESFDSRLLLGDSAALEYMTARGTRGDFAFKFFDAETSGPEFSVAVSLNGSRAGGIRVRRSHPGNQAE